ncbi:MAG: hypothetical protein EBT13_11305 [Rhodobacteraceae bacterium]|nr:hypothetical protein [Paracoccaceae bacterium]
MRDLECDTVPVEAVEAWMRVAHGTLDGLSPEEFREAAEEATVQACMAPDDTNLRLVAMTGADRGE